MYVAPSKSPAGPAHAGAERRPRVGGFTLLEILIAMAIFTVLGTMMVYFLRESLNIFYTGTRETTQMDRQDQLLPKVREDLGNIALPANFRAPALPPDQALLDAMGMPPPEPARAVVVRVRAGYVLLKVAGNVAYKGYPCPYIAFVVADASEASSRIKRRAGEVPAKGADLKAITPKTIREGDRDTKYQATGGLMEICWIAAPAAVMPDTERGTDDVTFPGILTLYRGWRTPIGHPEKSLLDPGNLDTPKKITEACTRIAKGLVHFGATWRRVFAQTWEWELGVGLGESAPYVGPVWDSTRALDKAWPLYRGAESLNDPSDDIFPAFVRLEATIAVNTQFGAGRGELWVTETVSPTATTITVSNTDILLQPGIGKVRWIKVDTEWMQFEVRDVDYQKGTVRVRRGMRGTKKVQHEPRSWCYVGTPSQLQMRLPVFHDNYVLREEK